ncbi:MAG: amidase, partial [Pseudomonas sp.]
MTDLHDLTAAQLLERFASRQLSPIDYYDHLLAHIDRWEPKIRALYAFDPEQVRQQAQACTERWNKGQPNG